MFSAIGKAAIKNQIIDLAHSAGEETGPICPKTEEGKRAPLRVINIFDPVPDDLNGLQIDRFTPAFVLIEEGVGLDRIRGYPDDELF